MKRHESLHALSQHHHFALIESWTIGKARQEPPARRAASLRRLAEKFLRFYARAGKIHFREEEEILLPAYARHLRLDEDKDVMRMLADHAAIRAKIADLASQLENGEPLEETLLALGQLLHDHVRLEENVIFPRMEKTLSESELRAVGKLLTRLHRKGEVCEI
jgi:hemerythrin-like domain-containing protein